jgi:acyl-coenzyme A thioesterase PaaI-like protein
MKVLWSAPTEKLPKVVDVTVDFLRSARAVDSYARSTIIKQGRRIVSVHTTSWQGDPTKPIATAHTHFLLRPLDDQTS